MSDIKTIECNDRLYYIESDLKELDKAYFYGCSKSRSMIAKKNIPETEYVFAVQIKKTGLWSIKNREYKPAKLLISKTWADYNVPMLRPPLPTEQKDEEIDIKDIKMAPPILKLEPHEKFRDATRKVLEIEVRGERNYKKCYFLVQDVSKVFELPNLRIVISNENTSYIEGVDFKNFIRPDVKNNDNTINRKMLYLTYEGLIKTLYVSRSPLARHFREWATEKLFTIQMGTADDKEFLASNLLGVPVETVWKFLSACVRDIPMVYMLHLGTVPDSIEVVGDRKDYVLFKVGQHGKEDTKCGFKGRSKGHLQEFKEFREELSYLHFVFIDPMYVSDAEKSIKDFFKDFKIDYNDKREVYLIPKTKMEEVKKFFEHLSVLYSGNHADIQREFDNFRHGIKIVEFENQHLKDMIKQKEDYYKTLIENLTTKTQMIIENLQERVKEQSDTIRVFISRMIPSNN